MGLNSTFNLMFVISGQRIAPKEIFMFQLADRKEKIGIEVFHIKINDTLITWSMILKYWDIMIDILTPYLVSNKTFSTIKETSELMFEMALRQF